MEPPVLRLRRHLTFPFLLLLAVSFPPSSFVQSEDDMECLQTFHSSVTDSSGSLSSWNFKNVSKGSVCSFNGVNCWNALENKVLNLKLGGFGLSGSFPMGLNLCSSLQGIDLSQNKFSGDIPSDICKDLPYITDMDLSGNEFSGNVPEGFQDCVYLNSLKLQENRLTGELPWQIGILPRLTVLDLSDNTLTGSIPSSYINRTAIHKDPFPASSFINNPGLCGAPLDDKSCGSGPKLVPIIGGALAGAAVLVLASTLLVWYYYSSRARTKDSAFLRDEHKWAKRMPKSVVVSLFEKPLMKLKLSELMFVTNDFGKENIIWSGHTGTVYKAFLADGSMLAVKRLNPSSSHSDKQFKSEMEILGRVRHRNLVPLLGYCVAGSEKLLIYKHMVNGSLKDWLHEVLPEGRNLDWPTRVKISIGIARGLSWLHHNCNPRIIHRNISSSVILLDDDYEPRITDFGLARLMNPGDTHISTFVNGDFGDIGYVAPEYSRTLVATVKGDVYSFGVVLLELVTGQKASSVCSESEFKGNLAEWVTFLSNNGRHDEAMDKTLKTKGFDNELGQILRIACRCIHPIPKERPTMYETHQMLRAIGQKYNLTDNDDFLPIVESKEMESIDEETTVRSS